MVGPTLVTPGLLVHVLSVDTCEFSQHWLVDTYQTIYVSSQ